MRLLHLSRLKELRSEQEEADTRLLLHVQHAATEQRYRSIIVSSEDTDVRILCLAFSSSIDVPIYQRCVSQMKARYVDINKIAHVIGQDVCKALPGLRAFTGCDAVSAFAGIGKVKPLKTLLSKVEYQRMFQQLGEHWLMSEDLLKQLEAFVCDIYGAKKSISDVNQCRYAVFCAKKGEVRWNPISSLHAKTACTSIAGEPTIKQQYGEILYKTTTSHLQLAMAGLDGAQERLVIDWMSGLPAPRAVIELMSCVCKKACNDNSCDCIRNGLKCSDLCRLTTCSNQPDEEEDLQVNLDEEDVDFD